MHASNCAAKNKPTTTKGEKQFDLFIKYKNKTIAQPQSEFVVSATDIMMHEAQLAREAMYHYDERNTVKNLQKIIEKYPTSSINVLPIQNSRHEHIGVAATASKHNKHRGLFTNHDILTEPISPPTKTRILSNISTATDTALLPHLFCFDSPVKCIRNIPQPIDDNIDQQPLFCYDSPPANCSQNSTSQPIDGNTTTTFNCDEEEFNFSDATMDALMHYTESVEHQPQTAADEAISEQNGKQFLSLEMERMVHLLESTKAGLELQLATITAHNTLLSVTVNQLAALEEMKRKRKCEQWTLRGYNQNRKEKRRTLESPEERKARLKRQNEAQKRYTENEKQRKLCL